MQTAVPDVASAPDMVEACDRCKGEFIVGSRYCHNCGAARSDLNPAPRRLHSFDPLQIGSFAAQFELSMGAFGAFVLGVFCLLGALAVGVVYSAKTVLDWQAVQLWRIEWLLASIAAFVAGCLLKRNR